MGSRRVSRCAAAAIACAAFAFGAVACGDESASVTTAPEPTADLYVSPTGSDTGAGNASDPFASFTRALAAARSGDVIEVAGGEYPLQSLWRPSEQETPPIVLRPAPGAEVVLDGLQFDDVDDVEIRDMTTTGWYIGEGSERVTLRGVRSRGSGSFITSADDIRIIGGSIGPVDSSDGLQIKSSTDGRDPTGILIDGLDMHDITREREPTNHVDCVQVGASVDLVIRNSRFQRCATQGIFLRPFGGGSIRNVLIENNWVGEILEGTSGIIVDEDVGPGADVRVRHNSVTAGLRVEPPGTRVTANIAPMQPYGCVAGVIYRHNVWSNATCGATDRSGPPGFVDPAAFDLRLQAGAVAINAGDPNEAPATDIDGVARPQGDTPDAGASEHTTG